MTNKNNTFVVHVGDRIVFNLATKAPPPGEISIDAIVDAYDTVTRAFREILTVTEAEVYVKQLAPSVHGSEYGERLSDVPGLENPVTLAKRDGVDGTDIRARLSEISPPNGSERFINIIKCTDSTVSVYLKDGIHALNEESDNYRFKVPGSDTYRSASDPAIRFKFNYSPRGYLPRKESDVFSIYIRTSTDVWFGESPIEQINRVRLHECIATLDEELGLTRTSVVDVVAGVDPTDVQAVFDYDGPSSTELIDRHQCHWIENEFTDSVEQRSDGKVETVVIEGVPGQAGPETVKRFLETYIDVNSTDETTFNADELIVITDDWKLSGILTPTGIDWKFE